MIQRRYHGQRPSYPKLLEDGLALFVEGVDVAKAGKHCDGGGIGDDWSNAALYIAWITIMWRRRELLVHPRRTVARGTIPQQLITTVVRIVSRVS